MTTTEQASRPERLTLPAILTDAAVPAVPAWLAAARAAVNGAIADTVAVADDALLRTWLFRGRDTEDGVRYGLYRAAETIEAASAELEAALAGAPARSAASIRSGPATIARWALQGRFAALDDTWIDRVPKPGEWTARETLAHILDGQRSYGWFSRWWLSQPLGSDRPTAVTDEAEEASKRELPKDGSDAEGPLSAIRAALDAALDEWALRLAPLEADALAVPAVWAGVPVDIGFRIGRWASHIDEHTIQLDKTLDWLGYAPPEAARIARPLAMAWGRLEARVFPSAPAGRAAAIEDILGRMGETLVSEARSAREIAEA
jgi:hypothetical protein